jgi:hypothetical protein
MRCYGDWPLAFGAAALVDGVTYFIGFLKGLPRS